jgi:hypothetical protein
MLLAHCAAAIVLLACLVKVVLRLLEPACPTGTRRPPLAPNSLPFIGHALAYKRDPAAFLTRACEAVGPVFRINLAGRCFVVVGPDRDTMRQVPNP